MIYGIYLFVISSSDMVIFQRFSTIESGREIRLNVLTDALSVFLSNPMFGVGWGNISVHALSSLNSHNDLAEVLASTGIIGFLLYLVTYIIIIIKFKNIYSYRFGLNANDKINFIHITILLISYFIYMASSWHVFSIYSSFVIGYVIYKLNNYKIIK